MEKPQDFPKSLAVLTGISAFLFIVSMLWKFVLRYGQNFHLLVQTAELLLRYHPQSDFATLASMRRPQRLVALELRHSRRAALPL